MVSGYFGVPGCGKSTFLAMIASKTLKRIEKGKSPYKHVLTNFPVSGCEQIRLDDLGKFNLEYCLILFDEISLDADSREYKSFPHHVRDFFVLHRHLHNDIIYFCQDYSKVDKVIRNVTYDLWYLHRPVVPFFSNFSIAKRIYRNININEYTSELTLGYRFAKFLELLFSQNKKICFRPFYYKHFDSFDKLQLNNLPDYIFTKW